MLMVAAGQFLYGLAMGIEGPLEMGYRQAITPAHLQGRTNTTMRATNRTMVVIGAPLGGAIAIALGARTVLWMAAFGMAAVVVWYLCSSMYSAKLPAAPSEPASS